MINRILVPIDDSPLAMAALEYVFENFPNAEIVAFHVLDSGGAANHIAVGGTFDEWLESAHAETDRLFEQVHSEARTADVSVQTVREIGTPAETILSYADELTVDQIVIGSHGRHGVARVLLGSVTETVTRRANVPVVVVRKSE